MMLVVYIVLAGCINSAFSAITMTPGIKRKAVGEACNFQWSVTGLITNYSVYNQTLGFPRALSKNANYALYSQSGVVVLNIWNIQLSDAGNYSLSVTIGTTVLTDAGALLFVYGRTNSFVNQTSDGSRPLPAVEGDRVELTCTTISTSLPVAYRPKIVYYKWWLFSGNGLKNISSGPAVFDYYYYELIPGYSIKNNGRTLVIDSAQYPDTLQIACSGQEEWSPYSFNYNSWFYLQLSYRPYVTSRSPASRKFNAIVGETVSLSFNYGAMPTATSATNWSFVDGNGLNQELPIALSYSNTFFSFSFTSEAYYGYYSIILSNVIGSTTVTFQVLRPGPPDIPSSVTANFVSSYQILIGWNCMWSNGRPQQIFLQLKSLSNNDVIDSLFPTVSTDCYNTSYDAQFRNGIQPETDYEVSVWSSNDLGSSDIVKLAVKTPKVFRFGFSPKDISFNGNQATVNFWATEANIAVLSLQCCLEETGDCDFNEYYNVNDTIRQVTCYNVPVGNAYVFDIYVVGGNRRRGTSNYYSYYLGYFRGVRASRTEESEADGSTTETNHLLVPAVIVLGVLFGIAVLALIGCFIALLVLKHRRNNIMSSNNSQPVQPKTKNNARARQPTPKKQNEAYEDDDAYQTVDTSHPNNNTNYTSLEGKRDS